MKGNRFVGLSKQTIKDFMADKALRLSAALAYYAIFSLAPLLIIVIAIASLVFDQEAVRGEVQRQLQGFIGESSAKTIESMIAAQHRGSSLTATIIGIATLIFGASGVFGQLQDALNTIWEVKPKPGRGIKGFIRDRFLSLTMVLGLGFLLLISMVITTLLEVFTKTIGAWLTLPPFLVGAFSVIVSFLVVTLLFAMIFKVLPDVTIKWRDVWIGALSTALLFTLGKYVLSLYLGRESTASAYGAAGSFVVILLWIYYSSVILFLGAEFTQVYANELGSHIVPTKNAVPVSEEARANQGMPSETTVEKGKAVLAGKRVEPGLPASVPSHARFAPPVKQDDLMNLRLRDEPPLEVELISDFDVPRKSRRPRFNWEDLGMAMGVGLISGWMLNTEISRKLREYKERKAAAGNGSARVRRPANRWQSIKKAVLRK